MDNKTLMEHCSKGIQKQADDPFHPVNLISRMPKYREGIATSSSAIGGATLGALAGGLLFGKRRRLLKALIGGGIGYGAGVGASILSRNMLEQLGGRWDPKDRPPLPVVYGADSDAPSVHYKVYIAGAAPGTAAWSSRKANWVENGLDKKEPNTALFRWGETGAARNFINSLRPQDTVELVGHSLGGAAAHAVAASVNRPVDKLVTLDPISWWTIDRARPKNVQEWLSYLPGKKDPNDASNSVTGLLGDWNDHLRGAKIVKNDADQHSSVQSGYRLPI